VDHGVLANLARCNEILCGVNSKAEDIVIVAGVEALTVGGAIIDNAECGNVVNDGSSIEMDKIVATIAATETENVVKLERFSRGIKDGSEIGILLGLRGDKGPSGITSRLLRSSLKSSYTT